MLICEMRRCLVRDMLQARLQGCLAQLYAGSGGSCLERIVALADQHRHTASARRTARWDGSDVVLITYGDQIGCPGQSPLETLREFLRDTPARAS